MKNAFFFMFFLIFSACVSEIRKPSPPKNLLSEKQMIAITKDLVLIEGHVDLTYKMINKYHKIISASSAAVFKKHGISNDKYERSFDYYAADQEKLMAIYSAVLDDLTFQKGKINSKSESR
jgi:Domain of unknown function (DUF4296)